MKGLVLAGGLGTGLRPLTHTGPKQLIPVANKPVLFYGIEDMMAAGIKEIGIIVGYTEERIKILKNAIGDGSRWGIKITYIQQDAPRGLAHAVYCAKDFMGDDTFVVHLGDNILKGGITKYVKDFENSDYDAAILLSEVEEPWKYGVATLNEKGEVIDLEEKPEKPKSNFVIVGVYFFKPTIFNAIEKIKPSKRGELEITSAIRELIISKDHKVKSYFTTDWWDDTGTAEALLRANHVILSDLKSSDIRGKVEDGVSIMGNVSVGEGSMIKRGSIIRGPVIIGKNCTIDQAYIGPYTSIGDNTSITGGEIESSVVIGDTRIECEKRIVDSLIGRHSTITSSGPPLRGYRMIIGENSKIQI
jgi:glucose-1-phosphate thymidylyltransferase